MFNQREGQSYVLQTKIKLTCFEKNMCCIIFWTAIYIYIYIHIYIYIYIAVQKNIYINLIRYNNNSININAIWCFVP